METALQANLYLKPKMSPSAQQRNEYAAFKNLYLNVMGLNCAAYTSLTFLILVPPLYCPNVFLQGHQSYSIRAHPYDLCYLNYLLKVLAPNTITF